MSISASKRRLLWAQLPAGAAVPAPRLIGSYDDGRWVLLVFECADGAEPDLRRRPADAIRVADALEELARVLTPAPIAAPSDHPRRGWSAAFAASARPRRGGGRHPERGDLAGVVRIGR